MVSTRFHNSHWLTVNIFLYWKTRFALINTFLQWITRFRVTLKVFTFQNTFLVGLHVFAMDNMLLCWITRFCVFVVWHWIRFHCLENVLSCWIIRFCVGLLISVSFCNFCLNTKFLIFLLFYVDNKTWPGNIAFIPSRNNYGSNSIYDITYSTIVQELPNIFVNKFKSIVIIFFKVNMWKCEGNNNIVTICLVCPFCPYFCPFCPYFLNARLFPTSMVKSRLNQCHGLRPRTDIVT